ncbi:hypothetical protein INT80_03765 [Gallibacterium anatis]|uniref:Uncharacterized protein n=1 Tax=Gallibacterium anatis TaxID=750 RepID=A0A930UR01_9PAST|nr:hypothetical protein [Gallibacterium anatis]
MADRSRYLSLIHQRHKLYLRSDKNNLAKLENSEDLNLQFTKDSDDNVTLSFNKDGNTIGKTIIEKASQFGTFSIGDGYYLDLNDGKFKYILSGESSNADLAQNTLHFNKGEELRSCCCQG